MKRLIQCAFVLFIAACGKPSEMSDADYEKYTQYGAPKILYSCTSASLRVEQGTADAFRDKSEDCRTKLANDEDKLSCLRKVLEDTKKSMKGPDETVVGYSAGVGVSATYNKLLSEAKEGCDGKFKIIDKKE